MVIAYGIHKFPELKGRKCDNCENAATDVIVNMADDENMADNEAIIGALCESCYVARELRSAVSSYIEHWNAAYGVAEILNIRVQDVLSWVEAVSHPLGSGQEVGDSEIVSLLEDKQNVERWRRRREIEQAPVTQDPE